MLSSTNLQDESLVECVQALRHNWQKNMFVFEELPSSSQIYSVLIEYSDKLSINLIVPYEGIVQFSLVVLRGGQS